MIKPAPQFEGLNITFQVTEDCNLRCKYCYEVNKKPGVLKLEDAKKFIDLLLLEEDPINAKNNKNISWVLKSGLIMDFIGGDALMVPELCDEILSYFVFKTTLLNHKWKRNWRANISTNGTLFEKENVRRFLEKYKNNLSIGISIDGCPEIHDKNRVFQDGTGSMSAILKSWDWFKNFCVESHNYLTTKATLNKDSIPYLYKSIKFMHEDMGLSYINMNFIFEDMGLTQKDYKEFDNQMSMIVDYVLEHSDNLYFSMLDDNRSIGKPTEETSLDVGYCGAGSMPCLTLNGKIYPCFRFTPVTVESNIDFNVGNIKDGFSKKHNFEYIRTECTRRKISDPTCLKCPIETACSWCIGGYVSCHGKFGRGTYLCKLNQIQDKHARNYWNRYNEMNNIEKRYEEVNYSNCLIQ